MPLSVFAADETIDDIPVEDMVLPEPPDAGAEANPDPYGIMPLAYNYSTIPESIRQPSTPTTVLSLAMTATPTPWC